MDVRLLGDLYDIQVLKARYFRYIDTGQWDSFRELFTEDLEYYIDDPSLVGSAAGEPAFVGPDALVTYLSTSDPKRRSVHQGHMPEIEFIDDDIATGIWAVYAWGEYPTRGMTVQTHGHFHERYRRGSDGRWRISSIRLTLLRMESTGPTPAEDSSAATA
jgi:hypothetical protein